MESVKAPGKALAMQMVNFMGADAVKAPWKALAHNIVALSCVHSAVLK